MNIDEANSMLASLRQRNAVEDLTLGNINLWPLFRLAVLYRVIATIPVRGAPGTASPLHHRAGPLNTTAATGQTPSFGLRRRSLGRKELLKDVITFRLPEPEPDLLLVQSFKDFTARKSGLPMDPLAEGIMALSDEFSVAYVSTIGHASLATAQQELGLVQPIDRAVRWPDGEVTRFLGKLQALIDQADRIARTHLVRPMDCLSWALRVTSQIAAWRTVFERVRPRSIMLQNYMALEKLAVCAAARSLGVPVIDHQHGMFTDTATVYLSWLDMPTGIIDPTPNIFWVWSDWFADRMPEDVGSISTVLGGDLRFKENILGPTLQVSAKKVVLYLHQNMGARDCHVIPKEMTELIAGSPSDWTWLIRLHPRFAHRCSEAAAELGNVGNYLITEPTEASLDDCLNACDAVVTGSSAAGLDSVDAGVPTIYTDKNMFSRLIAPKNANLLYHSRGSDIIEILSRTTRKPAAPVFIRRDPALARNALRSILGDKRSTATDVFDFRHDDRRTSSRPA